MKFTKTIIKGLTHDPDGPNQQIFWDEDYTGLGVRVYPSGGKSFLIGYRVKGRWRTLTLGRTPPLTLERARELATIRMGEVADHRDPAEEAKAWKEAPTVSTLCDIYLKKHAPQKKTEKIDKQRIEKRIRPKLGAIRLTELTRAQVRAFRDDVAKKTPPPPGAKGPAKRPSGGPYEANRTIALLSTMWNLAVFEWEILPQGAPNPAEKIKPLKEHKRKRYVRPVELPRIAEAIEEEYNLYVRALIWLYLFTGARKNELLGARWADVDLNVAVLRLPDTKSGEPQEIPLSEPAVDLLRTLPKQKGNPYVFPGFRKGKRLVNILKPWHRIRTRAGVPDLRLHDLRRSVGSWMSEADTDLNTIKAVLRHADLDTTLVYSHLSDAKVRAALEAHGVRIKAAAKGKTGGSAEKE